MTTPRRLRILSLSPFPACPPTFGAQRRIQGVLSSLARSHDVDAVALVPPGLDLAAAERGMREYCQEVLVFRSGPVSGAGKRLLQARSLLSPSSFERRYFSMPAVRGALAALLARRRYDVALVEFPFFSHYDLRRAPPGEPPPRIVLDAHNVEHDLARQMTGLGRGIARHLHNAFNWRKLRREELGAWRESDGVAFCSVTDEARALSLVPSLRTSVVPNAVDADYFRPRPEFPRPDGRTVLFLGTFNYFPNRDAVLFFLDQIWPRLAASHPGARFKVVGADPPPQVLARAGPRVQLAGLVDDVRPHLAEAAVVVAPLLIGGGTRLKIVEAMAMAKAVVATPLGAEGIAAAPGRELLLADDPGAFAAEVGRVLEDGALAARLGAAARALAEQRYSWDVSVQHLDRFFRDVIARPARP